MFTTIKKRAREDDEDLDQLRHDHKVFALTLRIISEVLKINVSRNRACFPSVSLQPPDTPNSFLKDHAPFRFLKQSLQTPPTLTFRPIRRPPGVPLHSPPTSRFKPARPRTTTPQPMLIRTWRTLDLSAMTTSPPGLIPRTTWPQFHRHVLPPPRVLSTTLRAAVFPRRFTTTSLSQMTSPCPSTILTTSTLTILTWSRHPRKAGSKIPTTI